MRRPTETDSGDGILRIALRPALLMDVGGLNLRLGQTMNQPAEDKKATHFADGSPVPSSILNAIEVWARKHPEKICYRFIDEKLEVTDELSFREIERVTLNLSRWLLASKKQGGIGLSIGDRVILAFLPGLDFTVTFLSCLRAGVVPVPVIPPRPTVQNDWQRFTHILTDSDAKVALTDKTYNRFRIRGAVAVATKSGLGRIAGKSSSHMIPSVSWIVVKRDTACRSNLVALAPRSPNDEPAFIQYTSGSTSAPKGVVISHRNIVHQAHVCLVASGMIHRLPDDNRVFYWLPLYHDMGLISSLASMYGGALFSTMSPISFIQNPPLWLEGAAKFESTVLAAPNFAFNLVVRKWPADLSVDLSSIDCIMCAAEPIQESAFRSFQRLFGSMKLRDKVIKASYGMAEHTLVATVSSYWSGNALRVQKRPLERDGKVIVNENSDVSFVSCGRPAVADIDLLIVNDAGIALKEDEVGKVWMSSPSKSAAYLNKPNVTEDRLQAKVLGGLDDNETTCSLMQKRWLRSGDLGFLHDGELYIVGRSKDLIIIRGRNIAPQDIEYTIDETMTDSVRPGCVAAFSWNILGSDDEETLALAVEVRSRVIKRKEESNETLRQIALSLRRNIEAVHSVTPTVIILLQERTIPKTSSGKIRRQQCRTEAMEGSLQEVFRWTLDSREQSLIPMASGPMLPLEVGTASEAPGERDWTASDGANDPYTIVAVELLRYAIATYLKIDLTLVHNDVSLQELGMDSMAMVNFVGLLDENYGLQIDAQELLLDRVTIVGSLLLVPLLNLLRQSPFMSPEVVNEIVLSNFPGESMSHALDQLKEAKRETSYTRTSKTTAGRPLSVLRTSKQFRERVEACVDALPDCLDARVDETSFYPLTRAQQRMLFIQDMNPDVGLYNIPLLLNLKEGIDTARLENAFRSLLEVHCVLCTLYVGEHGSASPSIGVVDMQLAASFEFSHIVGTDYDIERLAMVPFD